MRASDDAFFGSSHVTLLNSKPSVIPDAPPPPPPSSSEAGAAQHPEIPPLPRPQPPRPASPTAHPAGLPPPPSGRLDIPPGAYVYTGPALPPNTLGKSEWLVDEAVPNCMRCGEEFNLFTRRHHCRQCGQIFCHRCCNNKALLQVDSGTEPQARVSAHWFFGATETDPLKPQKVCGKCFDLLLPMQPYLTATNSKAVQAPDYTKPALMDWVGKPISRSFKLEIKKAVHNLHSFLGMPDDTVVRRLLDTAHGVALLSIVKVGFIGAVQGGGGLVLARDIHSGQWSAPCAVGCAGMSIGAQAGGELNTVMLILNNAKAVESFSGSASVTLGANLSVAVGPVGRHADVGGVAGNTKHAACYSYSVSRGAFLGVALDGTVVFTRDRLNHVFYGHPASAKQCGRRAPRTRRQHVHARRAPHCSCLSAAHPADRNTSPQAPLWPHRPAQGRGAALPRAAHTYVRVRPVIPARRQTRRRERVLIPMQRRRTCVGSGETRG